MFDPGKKSYSPALTGKFFFITCIFFYIDLVQIKLYTSSQVLPFYNFISSKTTATKLLMNLLSE
jgi:hypothetical protein